MSLYQIWEGLIEFSLGGGVMIFFRRVSNRPVLILLQNHRSGHVFPLIGLPLTAQRFNLTSHKQ